MKYLKFAAVMLVFAALLTGCRSSTHTKAHALPTSSAAKAQAANAQKTLDRCLASNNLLTQSGRTGFETCALPASERATFGSCLKADALSSSLHLHGLKAEAKQAAVTCLVKAEGSK